MKKLIESFRTYTEQVGSDINAQRIWGTLVISRKSGRNKADVLSDIRAIEGITTVSVESQRANSSLEFSELIIKIDTTPLKVRSMLHTSLHISAEIEKVKGVQGFKLSSRPEAL